jgi:hypothetical protein
MTTLWQMFTFGVLCGAALAFTLAAVVASFLRR